MDEQPKSRSRVLAAKNRSSVEDEARNALRDAPVTEVDAGPQNLIGSIRSRISPLGGIDLELPPR
jgi:antitoxin FitA